ncbi:MAG: AAA family ATPase [Lachnospiraceae bacterium]|nr:AAA family ATPase [Lachnospiraceae bacterium]
MKFRSIKLHNFMRYKGDWTLEFSCDEKNNVTVVLGDNTYGKTTLAQAFRWCLYGDIIPTSYIKKTAEAVLLNKEVIAGMDINDHQVVSVEIQVIDKENEYVFLRKATYKKKNNNPEDLSIVTSMPTRLTMQQIINGTPGRVIDNTEKNEPVQTQINNMFPKDLSNYLFFDGERWNEAKNKKEDIRNSVNTIIGLNASIAMARHLKDQNGSTIAILKKQINTCDAESERLKREIESLEDEIAQLERENEGHLSSVEYYDSMIEEKREILEENKKAEEHQEKLKVLDKKISGLERTKDNLYRDIVESFSSSARYFGGGILDELSEFLSGIELDGKNIPGVTVDTVDYLINDLKTCLCGACLDDNDEHFNNDALVKLKKLRNVIPPIMLGGAAGNLKDTMVDWKNENLSFVENFENKVDSYSRVIYDLDDVQEDRDKLEKKIDTRLNLEFVRKEYNEMKTSKAVSQAAYDRNMGKIESKKQLIESKQEQIDANSSKSQENRLIYLAIAYAEAAYKMAKEKIDRRASTVMTELNNIISKNFEQMFNGKEKYAKLGDDYKIHVYYRDFNGRPSDVEEETLSNGEIIAINYVFIVSILELARNEQQLSIASKDGSDTTVQLPLVLDAPFSNLSSENTGLVANNLPKFAEQVIVLMLDKDWEASGLSEYTGNKYCYHISKAKDSNSSSIERAEVI